MKDPEEIAIKKICISIVATVFAVLSYFLFSSFLQNSVIGMGVTGLAFLLGAAVLFSIVIFSSDKIVTETAGALGSDFILIPILILSMAIYKLMKKIRRDPNREQ